MINRVQSVLIAGVFALMICSSVVSATVSFDDEVDDVFFYPVASYDRDDPHVEAEVPEIDIESISCEVSTVGTSVILNITGVFPMEFGEDYYSYYVYIFPDKDVYDYDNFFLRADLESEEWESYFNANEHTYTISGSTLTIFFEGMFLNESTVGFQIDAIHTDADAGADRDWYPNGAEVTSLDGSGSENEGDTPQTGVVGLEDDTNETTDDTNESTPGFEVVLLLGAVLSVFFVLRRQN